MTMPEQAHHCSSGLTKPFAYERLFLWRLMHRGCHHSSDVPSLASSDTSHFSPVLERIDDRAFSYCDSLENVSFPPVLKTIGKDICLFKMPIEGILNKNILEIILLSQWNVVLLRSYMIVEYYNLKTNYKIMNRLRTIYLSLLFILAMNMTSVLSVKAENYPYRSDYLWLTVPDHADWLYKTGEQAKVEVSFYKYGIPRDGEVNYEIGDDMLKADKKGSFKLKNGRAIVNMGTRKTPGFRDLRLFYKLDGKTYQHHIKVGFSVDKIQPYTQEPKDFDAFWQQAKDELKNVPMSYTKELAKEYCTDKIDCYLVKLQIDKKGHAMYGYLFYPKNAKQGSHPVVLTPPGAGIKTIKEPMRNKYYAENGFIRFEIEIHGLDPRLPAETFQEISKGFNDANGGYLANGLEDKNRYYMRHVYQGLVRCIDFLTSLPEWDGKNVAVQGGSQGGALAIIAAGLDKRVTQCVANHPALSDMAAYAEKGRTGGYPHFNKYHEILKNKDCLNTMAYYDVVNFARKVKAPTYLTWGYNDNTCPPTTSYAVWNTLKCKKEALLTPINEHWTTPDTNYQQMVWIKEHLVK